jgi:dihydrofolate reductase
MSGRVVYLMNVSLDGYINDAHGSLDWANVDEELHGWFNERSRGTAVDLYGRRMYDTMASYWPTALDDPDTRPVEQEFARIWNGMPHIVFSRTLESAPFADRLLRTEIADEIAALKAEFDGEISVSGPTIAAALIARNLVDVYQLVVHPVVLGSGTPYFPPGSRLDLRLIETRRFQNGAVLAAYQPR